MSTDTTATAETTPATNVAEDGGFKVGQIVRFKGWSAPLAPDYTPVIKEGDTGELVSYDAQDQTWGVKILTEGDTKGKLDSVLVSEIEVQSESAPATAPAKRTAAKKAAKPADKQTAPPTPPAGKPAAKKAAAKKAATAPPTPPPAPVEEVIIDTASVQQAMAGTTMLLAAKSLVTQVKEKYYTLGGVLAHVLKEKAWLTILGPDQKPIYPEGTPGFAAYVETELGVRQRKAYDLISVYKHFSKAGYDATDLTSRLGWAKAAQIAGAVGADPSKAETLIGYAQAHSREEIDTYVKSIKGSSGGSGGGDPKPSKVRFAFALTESTATGAKAAIEAARKILPENANTDSDAFALIATEWAAGRSGVEVPLEQTLQFIEARYKVKLTVGDGTAAETNPAETVPATA